MNETKKEFRVALVNGKVGYGFSTWEALVNAVGEVKAELISNNYMDCSPAKTWYAKNGVVIATCEVRDYPA